MKKALFMLVLLLSAPTTISAHQGPPYPIIVDKKAGQYVISVWGDPDIGVGTFFVILESPAGKIPKDTKVQVIIQPIDKRIGEVVYNATLESLSDRTQYKTEVKFDAGGFWRTRFVIDGSLGKAELSADVEATPEGFGSWDILLYGFPFIAIAFLWIRAVIRKRPR